jgi:CopA family copper-resistance protein
MVSRRSIVQGGVSLAAALGAHGLMPAWALGAVTTGGARGMLTGTEFDLVVDRSTFVVDDRAGRAITVNGTVPAPLLRWREGDTVTLRVHNRLDEDTSIHWHGILLPFDMDGVPGISFPGIAPGETFTYRFPVRQAGTYWYHSHSNLQEQLGHYGPLIIDPRGADPVGFDRDYVVVLSDWTFTDPHRLLAMLKKHPESLNFQKRTVADFVRDARMGGFKSAMADRRMWGVMRMHPTDIADVGGTTYTYLLNGHTGADNWTALFDPGERVRLRIINASAMSIFNVRVPGLPMSVVQADGLDVQPVETDEFQIGVAETYDVVVTPGDADAYTLMCESIDGSDYVRGTLARRPGLAAPVPALRPRPLLTMTDMGMAHHDHGGGAADAHDHRHHAHHAHHGHSAHADHQQPSRDPAPQDHPHPSGPGVAGLPEQTMNRLHEPGVGLDDVPHRALSYAELRSLAANPDQRPPGREIELHLTGNMERYMWSFDGEKFSEVVAPIVFRYGERVRLTMVNDTMMPHPIHLHGMFFDVVNGGGTHKPRKHTIIVKPAEKMSVDITADAPGDWAFHCHLLYHMHAGMFRVVSVRGAPEAAA